MFLITQTLLSSWLYMFNCMEGCEEDAKESFLRVLNREPTETTEAMMNGRIFEDDVYRVASGLGPPTVWEEGVTAVSSVLRGACFQVKASRSITVDGEEYLVYGILDALKAGIIYDVKFLNKSMGSADLAGKYLESPQHPAYFYIVPEAREFIYLVSDGHSLYTEHYKPEECRGIAEFIREFIASIKSMGLYGVYAEKWVSK